MPPVPHGRAAAPFSLMSPLRSLLRQLPAAAVLLASCSSLPRPASNIDMPPAYQQASAVNAPLPPEDLSKWWARFGDPTLQRLIENALASSPDLRSAAAKVDEARARRRIQQAALLPSLTAGFSATGTQTDRKSIPAIGAEDYRATTDASWEIDLSGRLRANLRAAYADADQALENARAIRVSLAAEVAAAYVDLRSAETQSAVYARNVKARTGTTDITRWREQAGEGSALESRQADTALDQARAAIPPLQQLISKTRNRLSLLSGLTPGSLDSLLSSSHPIPSPPPIPGTGIPADLLRQRPDIRATERALAAAAARTQSSERERYPSLTLSGSINSDSLKASSFFSPDIAAARAAGNLTAPIFNAGRIRAGIAARAALEQQALAAYESSVLRALSEVEDALIAVRRTSERLVTLDRAVASAREAERLASLSYRSGQVDLLQVLDAQRTLLSLEEQDTIARGNLANAHIQLCKALGGGWQS